MENAFQKNLVRNAIIIVAIAAAGYYFFMNGEGAPATPGGPNTPGAETPIPVIDEELLGKVIKDEESGREFMSNEIIVEFIEGASDETIAASLDAVGALPKSRFTAVPMFLVIVRDDGTGDAAREAVRKFALDPAVKKAELNFLTTIEKGEFEKAEEAANPQ